MIIDILMVLSYKIISLNIWITIDIIKNEERLFKELLLLLS